MPVNALTRSAYRGINVLLLWLAAEEAGYSSNCWLTYRQAQALGGQVRKGEKSTMAVIYKSWHKQDEDENGNRIFDAEGNPVMVDVPVLKANPLFNVEQCDGLSLPEVATTVTENGANDTLNAVADRVLTMVNACGVKIHSLPQDRAYYTPVFDRIVLPLSSQFTSAEDYWSTLLHELVHSTGHAKRLNREGIVSSGGSYGDERYAFEELIAEMGSAFLCAQLGVTGNVQHENYIGAWLKILRADKKRCSVHVDRPERQRNTFFPYTIRRQKKRRNA